MKVGKSELYDYVSVKISKQTSGVLSEITDLQQSVKDEIRKNLKDVEFIVQKASALEEKIDKAIQKNVKYMTNTWSIVNKLSHATGLISFVDTLVNGIYENLVKNYLEWGSGSRTMEEHYPEVKVFVDSIADEHKELQDRRTKINTLNSELKAVIKSSSTGAKAYKNLVELGLDMTDFTPSTATSLPAVQKLSEDVCLVNGGC
jgi:hypothetical protein